MRESSFRQLQSAIALLAFRKAASSMACEPPLATLFPPAGASKGNPPPSFMHDHLHYSYYSYIHASIAGQLSSFPLHGRISNKLGRIKLSEAQSELVQAWSEAWSEAA